MVAFELSVQLTSLFDAICLSRYLPLGTIGRLVRRLFTQSLVHITMSSAKLWV